MWFHTPVYIFTNLAKNSRKTKRTHKRRWPEPQRLLSHLPAGQRGGRRIPLSGTNPDRNNLGVPSASAVRPDFHFFAVLHPDIGADADKSGHFYLNLKSRASRDFASLFHRYYLSLWDGIRRVQTTTLWPTFLDRRKIWHHPWEVMPLYKLK